MENFNVFASGTVERVSGAVDEWEAPGLYKALVAAGYPQWSLGARHFDRLMSLAVDGSEVTAHTYGTPAVEYSMGDAAEVFLAWRRANVKDG